jgi:hypothetical protein
MSLPENNIRLGCTVLLEQNVLAYFFDGEEKSFETLTPGPNVVKLLTAVIY